MEEAAPVPIHTLLHVPSPPVLLLQVRVRGRVVAAAAEAAAGRSRQVAAHAEAAEAAEAAPSVEAAAVRVAPSAVVEEVVDNLL